MTINRLRTRRRQPEQKLAHSCICGLIESNIELLAAAEIAFSPSTLRLLTVGQLHDVVVRHLAVGGTLPGQP